MISRRTQERLAKMTPEKRALIEAAIARHRMPEARAADHELRQSLDAEIAQTGGITTDDGTFHPIKTKPQAAT